MFDFTELHLGLGLYNLTRQSRYEVMSVESWLGLVGPEAVTLRVFPYSLTRLFLKLMTKL